MRVACDHEVVSVVRVDTERHFPDSEIRVLVIGPWHQVRMHAMMSPGSQLLQEH